MAGAVCQGPRTCKRHRPAVWTLLPSPSPSMTARRRHPPPPQSYCSWSWLKRQVRKRELPACCQWHVLPQPYSPGRLDSGRAASVGPAAHTQHSALTRGAPGKVACGGWPACKYVGDGAGCCNYKGRGHATSTIVAGRSYMWQSGAVVEGKNARWISQSHMPRACMHATPCMCGVLLMQSAQLRRHTSTSSWQSHGKALALICIRRLVDSGDYATINDDLCDNNQPMGCYASRHARCQEAPMRTCVQVLKWTLMRMRLAHVAMHPSTHPCVHLHAVLAGMAPPCHLVHTSLRRR